jgi:hypothetical protein
VNRAEAELHILLAAFHVARLGGHVEYDGFAFGVFDFTSGAEALRCAPIYQKVARRDGLSLKDSLDRDGLGGVAREHKLFVRRLPFKRQ